MPACSASLNVYLTDISSKTDQFYATVANDYRNILHINIKGITLIFIYLFDQWSLISKYT